MSLSDHILVQRMGKVVEEYSALGATEVASLRIEAIAARHGRTVDWHCLLLGVAVMKAMGLKPLLDTPMKGDYVIRDAATGMG